MDLVKIRVARAFDRYLDLHISIGLKRLQHSSQLADCQVHPLTFLKEPNTGAN